MCSERSKPCTTGALKETGRFEERMASAVIRMAQGVAVLPRQDAADRDNPCARRAQGAPGWASVCGLARERGEAHHVDLPCLA